MYYSTHYTTKWHDTDGDGVMRPSALLVYMQETANLQCREYGMDLNDLHHVEGKGFLLSRIMVKVFSPLHAYEDIEVRTWCIDNKSYDFIRCFAVYRGDEMTALAVSHWALLDIQEEAGHRTIVYSDLDFNRHMNNTRYPDMICDFLPSMDGKWVTSLSLSYLREAAFGDTLTVYRAPVEGEGEGYLIRTKRPDGLVCLEAEIGLAAL